LALTLAATGRADGPQDNIPANVRRVPPPGTPLPDVDRKELEQGRDELGKAIEALPKKSAYLPDVQIFFNAVDYALRYDEIYNLKNELPVAKAMLKQGMERAKALADGKHPWTEATGLVARGYLSAIDGSVQPYGIRVPADYKPGVTTKSRLDLWCHGRGENLTELNFLNGVQKSDAGFPPKTGFLVQLYGRYCCANKFAGEIDALEVMNAVKRDYPIDDDRVVIRGFSMGGAACWQFAVHYTDLWAAAAPGAGFSETQDFLKVFQKESLKPTWYEQKLWHWYDCTDTAANLANLPTIAYSGEIDSQKQAADMMEKAMKAEGLELVHIIGPKTGHSYEKSAKEKVIALVDEAVAKRRDTHPAKLRFTTYTLRYNRMHYLTVDGLDQHWERARVDIDGDKIKTSGVTAMTLKGVAGNKTFFIDGQEVPNRFGDSLPLTKVNGKWGPAPADDGSLRKRHGLQGPIDDAFLSSFMMVAPSGKPLNESVGKWADGEMKHAYDHWRKQFRGEARIKKDTAVTRDDIAEHNLVLWGDPSSNAVLAKIADKLPVKWTAAGVEANGKKYSSADHVPVLIYPNPLYPHHYVVLNSGFTFREYDYLNNARQVPKLPDWAVIDVTTPPNARWPGKVADAGFFDERWQFKAEK
jgi:hypothetical protein